MYFTCYNHIRTIVLLKLLKVFYTIKTTLPDVSLNYIYILFDLDAMFLTFPRLNLVTAAYLQQRWYKGLSMAAGRLRFTN